VSELPIAEQAVIRKRQHSALEDRMDWLTSKIGNTTKGAENYHRAELSALKWASSLCLREIERMENL
jgi:hypothetical protein